MTKYAIPNLRRSIARHNAQKAMTRLEADLRMLVMRCPKAACPQSKDLARTMIAATMASIRELYSENPYGDD